MNATACAKAHDQTWAGVARGTVWDEDVAMAKQEFSLSDEQAIELGRPGRYSTNVIIQICIINF